MVLNEDLEEELVYEEVSENIFSTALVPNEVSHVVRLFETSRMSCIALPDELCFVDTTARIDLARKFRADMEDQFGLPTTHLFLTHDHWDHTTGMGAFEDVNIVMSSAGCSYFRRNIKNGVYTRWREWIVRNTPDDPKLRESLLNSRLFIPNIGVPKEKKFGSESHPIIFTVTGGHSKPSATIYVPSEKAFFTGDNLTTCYPPFFWK